MLPLGSLSGQDQRVAAVDVRREVDRRSTDRDREDDVEVVLPGPVGSIDDVDSDGTRAGFERHFVSTSDVGKSSGAEVDTRW